MKRDLAMAVLGIFAGIGAASGLEGSYMVEMREFIVVSSHVALLDSGISILEVVLKAVLGLGVLVSVAGFLLVNGVGKLFSGSADNAGGGW